MSTDNISAESAIYPEHDDFVTYPIHKVVSIFEDTNKVNAAVAELRSHGFKMEDIEAFCGWQGEKRMDFEGTRHGIWAEVVRALQHIGPDRTYLERYEKHLQEGHCMITVAVKDKNRKASAAEILHRHTNERVTYFGLLAASEV
jgi:hypothetical protein